MNRKEVEAALKTGRLQVRAQTAHGSLEWLDVRKAGGTKTWKDLPTHFVIPVVTLDGWTAGAVNHHGAKASTLVRVRP